MSRIKMDKSDSKERSAESAEVKECGDQVQSD